MHSIVPLSPETRTEALVALGLPIVDRVASRIARRVPRNIEIDDLTSAGREGLLRAIASFDPARGERFEPYAEARIRGAILDELRGGDPLTRHGRRRFGEIARVAKDIELREGRPARDEEIASALGMDLERYQTIAGELGRATRLARAAEIDPDAVESERVDPASAYAEREELERLERAIAALPERTRDVVRMYYEHDRTQADIGRELGVTESRVCQILRKSIELLRAALTEPAAA